MKEWQQELGVRWEAVRVKGRKLRWHEEGGPFVADLARRHGLEWFMKRGQDRVSEFMPHDADSLFNRLYSFGETKCRRLIEILEAASDGTETADCGEQSVLLKAAEVLDGWGVPRNYPLHLVPLPTRLVNFCKQQQINSLPMLLDVWDKLGWNGLLAQEHIGRRTAQELRNLSTAITTADASSARRWLPLNDSETRLCLRRALVFCHGALTAQEVDVLTLRLVEKWTLEESAADYGITRERVRQYEAAYLKGIRDILEWFSHARATMLEAWMEGREWQAQVFPQTSSEAAILILAGIESCFADTPQGVARRLVREAELQGWLDELTNHRDLHLGGVDLQSYLDSTVAVERQPEFIGELTSKGGVVIDLTSGLVKPLSPCVRDTLCAILAQEEDAIPLTWLAHRVQGIEGCEEGDSAFILRNRYRWSQLGFLDLSKVLWNE
jgi:hypothetical protein